MRPSESHRRALAVGLMVYSVLLSLMELGRIAVSVLAVAAAATAVWLPLHLWHLHHGLRGDGRAGMGWTLLVLGAVQVTAGAVVGPAWAVMLAGLATSALVVLRPVPATLVLMGCAVYAAVLPAVVPEAPAPVSAVNPAYLAAVVVFRSVLQFSLVWLVAAVERLELATEALVAEAVEHARQNLSADLTGFVEADLRQMTATERGALTAPTSAGGPADVRVRQALDDLADRSRRLLAEVRSVSAAVRSAPDRTPR